MLKKNLVNRSVFFCVLFLIFWGLASSSVAYAQSIDELPISVTQYGPIDNGAPIQPTSKRLVTITEFGSVEEAMEHLRQERRLHEGTASASENSSGHCSASETTESLSLLSERSKLIEPKVLSNVIFVPDCPGSGYAWIVFTTGPGVGGIQFWGNQTWNASWECLITCTFIAKAFTEVGDSIWYAQVTGTGATITSHGCVVYS